MNMDEWASEREAEATTLLIDDEATAATQTQPLSFSKLASEAEYLDDAELMIAPAGWQPTLNGNHAPLRHVRLVWDQRTERCERCLGDGDEIAINALNEDRLVTCSLCAGSGIVTIALAVLIPEESR